MGFKEQVAADIPLVFLNPKEFGETHNLDGAECTCVIFGDTDTARSAMLHGGKRTPEGLYGDTVTICVKESDLLHTPKQGAKFTLDGKRFVVDTCTEDIGMLTIVLGAYRMGAPGR